MALQAENPGKTSEYILEADRESSAPTKFVLRPLTWSEMSEIGELVTLSIEQLAQIYAISKASREEKRELTPEEIARINEISPVTPQSARRLGQQHAIAVRYGVVKIHGLLDFEGQPLEVSSAEFARIAPLAVLHELGTEIMNRSRHSEGAIKK